MARIDVRIDRSTALRWLSYAVINLATLAGLFAMHGLTMAMPAAMPMSSSSVVSSSVDATSTTRTTGPASSAVANGVTTTPDAGAVSASIAASPMAGSRGGCDAEHDGCLATLRGQPHLPSPAPVTLTPAIAGPAALVSNASRAELLGRGPAPPRPCLTELCISRT